jgi:hypothetical protein
MIRIEAPHFVAAVILGTVNPHYASASRVVRAAPILRYMQGWTEQRVIAYCEHRGWLRG